MGRYGSPPPGSSYSPPHTTEHLADAIDRAFSTYAAVRGMKQEDADRQRAEEDRQRRIGAEDDARDYRDARAASEDFIHRGTRPVDGTSVVSGVTLNGVGRPTPYNPHARDPYSGDEFAAVLDQQFREQTRGRLGGSGADAGLMPEDRSPSVTATLPPWITPTFPTGAQGVQYGGASMADVPAEVRAPVRPPGSFDPSTGTFTRAPLPLPPMMQEPDFRQLSSGRFQDVGALRAQQQAEFEAKLTEAMLLAEGRAGVQSRHRVPSQHERISARVGELVSGGMPLGAASRQARLEHGLTDGDGRGSRADTPPEVARRNLPIYNRDVSEADREVRSARGALPSRAEYEVQDREGAFPGDSTAAANRLRDALGRQDEARLTRDSVRAEVLGLPWERPEEDAGEGYALSPEDAQAMDEEFRTAAELYRGLLAKGVDAARARRAYDKETRKIAGRYAGAGR